MDIATIIGLILGALVVLGAMILGGSISMFIEPVSIVVVIIGTVAAIFIAFPLKNILNLVPVMLKTLDGKSPSVNELIAQLVGFAEIARRDGILSLENHMEEMSDPFIIQGVQMAVDGTDPELIEQIMEADLENLMERHATSKKILDSAGRYAPAFGMIGTLIGLVAMLSNMSDPSGIGAGMAVALLTTLYGAIVANVIFLPLADKLGTKSEGEVLVKSVIIRGVMSIQAGDNPRVVEQKLRTFLPPKQRTNPDDEMAAAA